MVLIKEARAAAASWVRAGGGTAAFLTGSTLGRRDDDVLPRDSDLDIIVVADGPEPFKVGKLTYQGVRLDVSYLAAAALADPDAIARTHYLAPSFATTEAILVDDGRLRHLAEIIAPRFAEPAMIRARCADVTTRMESGLARVGPSGSWAEQVQGWIFPISLPTQVLLVAALRPPTVRLRYLRVRELLRERGRPDLYAVLLDLLGCRDLDPDTVHDHLGVLDHAFAAAAGCPGTGFAFVTDITEPMRDATVGATRRLAASGDHREAVFWLMVTLVRCQLILDRVGEPGVRDACATALQAATQTLLGVGTPADLQQRADRLIAWSDHLDTEANALIGTR